MRKPQILDELGASATQIRDHLITAGRDPVFANIEPGTAGSLPAREIPGLLAEMARSRGARPPARHIPVVDLGDRSTSADEFSATWLGHASVLVEIGGRRVLLDPVFEERVSPSRIVGPRRMHAAPARASAVTPDAVVISHDHYDHLERRTIQTLAARSATRFVVPLGIGAHLRHWGVAADRIDELGWGEDVVLPARADAEEVRIVCTQARHFSGRTMRRSTTLWASWVLRSPSRSVYFGGDTGYTQAFTQIGAEHGPFDLTILPIGAYHPSWRDIHMDPEEAVRAHVDLGGQRMLPVHWATFDLAMHPWAEPIERLLSASEAPRSARDIVLGTPRPGERWDLADAATGAPETPWWRSAADTEAVATTA